MIELMNSTKTIEIEDHFVKIKTLSEKNSKKNAQILLGKIFIFCFSLFLISLFIHFLLLISIPLLFLFLIFSIPVYFKTKNISQEIESIEAPCFNCSEKKLKPYLSKEKKRKMKIICSNCGETFDLEFKD